MTTPQFALAALWTAVAGTTLRLGITSGAAWALAAGAAMSAVCPWGLIGVSLMQRRRQQTGGRP